MTDQQAPIATTPLEAQGSTGTVQLTEHALVIIRSKRNRREIPLQDITAVTLGENYFQIVRTGETPPQPGWTASASHDGSVGFIGTQRPQFTAIYERMQSQLTWATFQSAGDAGSPLAHDTRNNLWGCAITLVLIGGLVWGVMGIGKAVQRKATVAKTRATAAQQQADAARAATSTSAATPANTGAIAAKPTAASNATYPFQAPSAFPAHSPERALASYMQAWKTQDWTAMAKCTQLTWQQSDGTPAETLKGMNDFRALTGFRILDTSHVSESCADIRYEFWAEMALTGTPEVKKATATARVVCETASHTPSPQGTWGVNPIIPSTAQ